MKNDESPAPKSNNAILVVGLMVIAGSAFFLGRTWTNVPTNPPPSVPSGGPAEDIRKDVMPVLVETYLNGLEKSTRQIKKVGEGKFVNHGHFASWHENGEMQSKGEYRDGKNHGKWSFWNEHGTLVEEAEYDNGVATGTWQQYYSNGNKSLQLQQFHGKPHGKWTRWHSNGKKSGQGEYVDGEPVGTWTFWDTSGKETVEVHK